LVVAGGAGSGYYIYDSADNECGGGGGAGGYRAASGFSVSSGTVYTVTVGAGGVARDNGSPFITGNGNNSVFSTITSTGGGGGGAAYSNVNYPGNGIAGGSGGGGFGGGYQIGGVEYGFSGTGGAGNTPSTSPSQGNNGADGVAQSYYTFPNNGGGGGGSGGAASGTTGGAGTANSITGSSVTYAAGGSGVYTASGGAGAANTGNGGRAASFAGGSGIVVIKYSDAFKAATTTGSPTYTVSGGFRIYRFTGSGSITW
jgi:hypothetical protein